MTFLISTQLMRPLITTFSGRAQQLKQRTLLSWTEDMLQAFNATKQALADATMLAHPQHDAPIALSMDASDMAVGGVLKQFVNSLSVTHGSHLPVSAACYNCLKPSTALSTVNCLLSTLASAIFDSTWRVDHS